MPNLWEIRQKNAEERKKRLKELASNITSNRVGYIVDIILKEVRSEHRLIMQILYTLFSVVTPDPKNLAVNAPTGEGKTYVVKMVAAFFPDEYIQHLGGMSEKSLFHRRGDVVVKEDENRYVPIEKFIDDIKMQIEDLEEEIKDTTGSKLELRKRKRLLETELENYEKEAIKRIDLRQKVLIFQDTPDPKLLETIMPLLSHDQPRVFYEFVNTSRNDIKTTQNMIEGWPSVIYCQAIDSSNRERWPELLRRFIIGNPEMTEEKYEGAIDQMFKSNYTDNKYESEVVTKEQKETVKGLILEIIETLQEHFLDQDRNVVIIPFDEALLSSLSGKSAFDVSVAGKTHSLLVLLPMVNIKERPYLFTRDEKKIPFCTFKDLEDSLYINEFVYGGLRQYILQWYISVFYNVWNKKKLTKNLNPGKKNGKDAMELKYVAYLDELVARTKEVTGEILSHKQILDKYITPLINHGYIDEIDSEVIKGKVYYPTSHEIVNRYELDKDNKLKLIKKLQLRDITKFPSKRFLYSRIEKDMKSEPESKLMDFDGREISINELIEKYYPEPEEHFQEDRDFTDIELDKITSMNTENTPIMEIFSKPDVNEVEEYRCKNCGKAFMEADLKEHEKYDECTPRTKSKMLDDLNNP